jgi:hypothetical protein
LQLRFVILTLTLLSSAAPLLAPGAVAPGSGPTFASPVTLLSSAGHAEPSIITAPDGTIYITGPCNTALWRSDDGGAHYARKADSRGSCGDSDVAVDANGIVYLSDLFNNVPVSVSTDRGEHMDYVTVSGTSGSNDRQWIAAHGNGNVWSIWRDGSTERVAISHDQARTWTRVVAGTSIRYQGGIVATSDTDLYIPITSGSQAGVLISHDAGLTWARRMAGSITNGTFIFPAVAVDAAGTIYLAWSEGGVSSTGVDHAQRIAFTSSANDGATWAAKQILSPVGEYNIFPWLVADAAGKVAVAWYDGVPPVGGLVTDANYAALTSWYVRVAYSADGGASWSSDLATPLTHMGPICTNGTGCVPVSNPIAGSREVLDFFEIAEMPDGKLVFTYAGDQTPGNPLSRSAQLYAVAQNAGPGLK